EGSLVRLGRLVEAADLSDELQGGGVNLFLHYRRFENEKGSDIFSHRILPSPSLPFPLSVQTGTPEGIWLLWCEHPASCGESAVVCGCGEHGAVSVKRLVLCVLCPSAALANAFTVGVAPDAPGYWYPAGREQASGEFLQSLSNLLIGLIARPLA